MDLVLLAITNIIALIIGFAFFSMLAANCERKQGRWIKRAVPILKEYYAWLAGQQVIPGRAGGKRLVDEVGRLLSEIKEAQE